MRLIRNGIKMKQLFNLRGYGLALILPLLASGWALGQKTSPTCSRCAVWNTPQPPFRIYGNTYYVGPHGLSSILIVSDGGLVLVDGTLPESVPQIVANIRSLGLRIEDVKLIVNSHVHFDHAGGIAELQRLSGATVLASRWSAAVMREGGVARDDPQFGEILPIAKVAKVRELSDGEAFHLGGLTITAHLSPGHTPGGTSWTWQSCEESRCLNVVYADSLSPVATESFKFTRNDRYPGAIADFEKSIAFLNATPCDLLLTPHPDASDLWERLDGRRKGLSPDPMIDPAACKELAERSQKTLQARIAAETGK